MKPRILLIGSELRYHCLTLNDELPQFSTELLKIGDTAPLFHGREDGIRAVVLNSYYSQLPQGITLKDCPTGKDAGIVAFKKLQPLYPSTQFFVFGLRGTSTLSKSPNLVRMEHMSLIGPDQLLTIMKKWLKIRRAKSAFKVVY